MAYKSDRNMDQYKYSPNGIDYDPDLLYGGQEPPKPARRKGRQASAARDYQTTSPRDYYERSREDEDELDAPAAPRRKRQRSAATPSDVDRMARRAENDRMARRTEDDRVARRAEADRRDREREEREANQRIERARMREKAEKERRERMATERRVREAERAAEKAARRAEKEAARKDRKPFSEWGIVKFFCDKRTHAFFGVVLCCVAVYLLIAAISFMKSGDADQSMVNSMTVQQITATGGKVANDGGPVGATVAQLIFAQGLGLGSLTAIIYLAILGLGLMGIKKCHFWSLTFKCLLVAVAISVVAGFVSLWAGAEQLYGGVHGQFVNEFLVANIDWIGAAMVSLLLIVAVIYLYLNDIISVYNKYKALQKARREKAEQIQMEREEAQARVIAAMKKSSLDADEEVESEEDDEKAHHDPISVGFDDEIEDELDEFAITDSDNDAEDSDSEAKAQISDDEEFTHIELKQDDDARNLVEEEVAGETNEDSEEIASDSSAESSAESSVDFSVDSNADSSEDQPKGETIITLEIVDQESEDSDDAEKSQDNVTVEAAEDGEPAFEVTTNSIEQAEHISADTPYDPTAELSHYHRPTVDLLNEVEVQKDNIDMLEQEANKERIINVLRQFSIEITKIDAIVGPTVTLYKIVPAEGVRIARIKGLEDDIAMALAAKGIRIIAPIPGESTVGIEVPNQQAQTVSIRSILSSKAFQESKAELPMAMGATIANEVYVADLAQMPHMLVAGATGQGKSVGLNTIIASLLYKKHPAELKFVLIDPKRVEFSNYASLENHFLAKLPDDDDAIVTNMDNVVRTLNSLCVEMEKRYDLLKDAHVVKVTKYNELFVQKKLNPEKGHRYLPYIVIIIDEFADLIMTAGKQVETPIARIAQMARAVGMHMIIATQRPSTNVITGLIKANFPGRVAFRVNQMVDSRTILDCPGANQLIGRGDMLFSHNGSMERVQCAFIDTPEVHRICECIMVQNGFEHPYFLPEPLGEDGGNGGASNGSSGGTFGEKDPLLEEVAYAVVQTGVASTSSVQRRWSIGYNRAGKIMDQLEALGIVGPATGGKARSVLVDASQLQGLIG